VSLALFQHDNAEGLDSTVLFGSDSSLECPSGSSLEVFQTIFKYTIYWKPNIHSNLRCGDGLVECSDGLVHRCPYVLIAHLAHIDGWTVLATTGGFFRSLLTVIVMTFCTSMKVSNRFTDRPKMPKSPNLRNAKRFVGCSALENTPHAGGDVQNLRFPTRYNSYFF
jgi:hypothetical protein